jgi:hypothetical protein
VCAVPFFPPIFVMSSGCSPASVTASPQSTGISQDSVEMSSENSSAETLALSSPASKMAKMNHRRTRSDVICDFSFVPRSSTFVHGDAASIYSTENRAPYRNCSHSSQSSSTAASPPRSYSDSQFSLRNLEVVDRFAHLHDQVLSMVAKVSMTECETLARTQVIQTIQHLVASFNPAIAVEPFGSFCTGLSLSTSDVDIVLTRASSTLILQPPTSQAPTSHPRSVNFISSDKDNSFGDVCSAPLDETEGHGQSADSAPPPELKNWWEIPPPDPESEPAHNLECVLSAACCKVSDCTVACPPLDAIHAVEAFSLDDVAVVLQSSPRIFNFRYIKTAKIPIIKLVVGHDVPGVDPISVDVTCAVSSPDATSKSVFVHSGIRVRDFVKLALQDYPSIKAVVMLMKVILTKRGLSNPYRGGLGSYPLFIMVYYWSRFRSQSGDSVKLGREGEEGALGRILMEFLKWAASMFPWETSVLDWVPLKDSEGSVSHFIPIATPRDDVSLSKSTFAATVVIMDPLNPGTNVAAVRLPCSLYDLHFL